VKLEDCKVDEHGLAVHEECYVEKIALKNQAPTMKESTDEMIKKTKDRINETRKLIKDSASSVARPWRLP
jgi:hypothetical protein